MRRNQLIILVLLLLSLECVCAKDNNCVLDSTQCDTCKVDYFSDPDLLDDFIGKKLSHFLNKTPKYKKSHTIYLSLGYVSGVLFEFHNSDCLLSVYLQFNKETPLIFDAELEGVPIEDLKNFHIKGMIFSIKNKEYIYGKPPLNIKG